MAVRPKLNRIWASNGLREDPANRTGGGVNAWVIEKPPHGEMNWLQNAEWNFFLEVTEQGAPYWRDNVQYRKGSICFFQGKFYISNNGSTGAGTDPVTNPSLWKISFGCGELTCSAKLLQKIMQMANDHINDTSNPHNVVAGQVNTYTKAEFNKLLTDSNNTLVGHKNNKDNPHRVTAAQIGILPKSGGDFVQVDFESDKLGIGSGFVERIEGIRLKRAGNSLGIGDDNDTKFNDEFLIHDGNFVSRRNVIEPLYATPTPDLFVPLATDLSAWNGFTDLTYSKDSVTFDGKRGIHINSGKLTFDASEGLGYDELTISITLSGNTVSLIGDVSFAKAAGRMVVNDGGGHPFELPDRDGRYTYVRTKDAGILYFNGVEQARKSYSKLTTAVQADIEGVGYVRDIKIWSCALTKEQATTA